MHAETAGAPKPIRITIEAENVAVSCSPGRVVVSLDVADLAGLLSQVHRPTAAVEEPWVGVKQLAAHLGVCERTVRTHLVRLPRERIGGWKFKLSAVEEAIRNNLKLLRARRRRPRETTRK